MPAHIVLPLPCLSAGLENQNLLLPNRFKPRALVPQTGDFILERHSLTDRLLVRSRRAGKKPLYYTHRAGRFLFGSEIKAILADPDVDREIDPVAIDEYLSISCIAAPRSVFRHVRKLPPAHRLLLRDGALTIERYWTLRFEVGNPPASEESYLEGLDHHLKAAVERRLISDVPLGALLSGGVDSSAVVGTMARLVDRPVKTFSIGCVSPWLDM